MQHLVLKKKGANIADTSIVSEVKKDVKVEFEKIPALISKDDEYNLSDYNYLDISVDSDNEESLSMDSPIFDSARTVADTSKYPAPKRTFKEIEDDYSNFKNSKKASPTKIEFRVRHETYQQDDEIISNLNFSANSSNFIDDHSPPATGWVPALISSVSDMFKFKK